MEPSTTCKDHKMDNDQVATLLRVLTPVHALLGQKCGLKREQLYVSGFKYSQSGDI